MAAAKRALLPHDLVPPTVRIEREDGKCGTVLGKREKMPLRGLWEL